MPWTGLGPASEPEPAPSPLLVSSFRNAAELIHVVRHERGGEAIIKAGGEILRVTVDVLGPAPATPDDLEDEEVFAKLAAAEARIAAALAEHVSIDGYCTRCTQDEEQPQPVGWWFPYPCPTVHALSVETTGTEGGGGHE